MCYVGILMTVGLFLSKCSPIYSECQPDADGQRFFGDRCEKVCHCYNGGQCDITTGNCQSGCDSRWMGEACQLENIAFEASARHLDNTYRQLWAYYAVDRSPTTCSETNFGTDGGSRRISPLWRVYFVSTKVIRRIVLSLRSENIDMQMYSLRNMYQKVEILTNNSVRDAVVEDFIQGFNVTVENVTHNQHHDNYYYPTETSLCYLHEPNTNLSSPFEIFCGETLTGNQVRVQLRNKDTQLALCDVKINGDCPQHTCGQKCDIVCHCKDLTLDESITGNCSSECTGRWTGLNKRCDTECNSTQWGESCQNVCGKCLNSAHCDIDNGTCLNGCDPGYRGHLCVNECSDGLYGSNCGQNCSQNCKGICNHIDGRCEEGCKDGYLGNHCNEKCSDGLYGSNCGQNCSQNCKGICNHIDGRCEEGCKDGYLGNHCNEKCFGGRYGSNCGQNCSQNCKGICYHIDGRCEEGCKDGYLGNHCNETCSDGRYGSNCGQNCSQNCKGICYHIDGRCEEGCKDGYIGNHCNENCSDGQYGTNCEETCNRNCKGICNHIDGRCEYGCTDGYLGDHCNKTCTNGSYGQNCLQNCSANCQVQYECNHIDGICENGCSPGWQDGWCDKELISPTYQASTSVIAGGSIGALVVISVIILGVFLLRHRHSKLTRSSSTGNTAKNCQINKRNDVYENSGIFFGMKAEDNNAFKSSTDVIPSKDNGMEEVERANDNVYYNNMDLTVPRSAIYLSSMRNYIVTYRTTNRLDEEFKSVPYGLQYPTTVALKPANRSKNRYKDMYPYDHSRVILSMLPGKLDSDYINACYVDGFNRNQEFIAAQGPVDGNVADFWRMIWEKNVNTIIMLTNLVEKGKMKCLEYWKEKTYNNLSVKMTSEDVLSEMTTRTITIKEAYEQKSISVTQCHFTAWPDKSTPHGATGLVHFLHKTRKHWKRSSAPVVVHCSAGVGRTGTFIAMDVLYEQGKKLGYIDILGVTQKLREQRINAVQTKGQYAFLHEAAYEMLLLPATIEVPQFVTEYSQLLEVDNDSGQVILFEQFKKVQETLISEEMRNEFNCIRAENDELSEAKKPENRDKNRCANILAANAFRPFLSTPVEGCNNYINAVYIQGNTDPYNYLLTQCPLAATKVDCCRLITERSIKCVVTFDWQSLKRNEMYLPDGKESLTIGPFKVTKTKEDIRTGYTVRNYNIEYKDSMHAVEQFIFTDWDTNKMLPNTVSTFHNFLEDMQCVMKNTEGSVLVQCMNGADKSGLFVVLINVLEQMKSDGEVAISQAMRQARLRREQIISVYDQYKFCHDLIQFHLEETSVYANV